MTPVERIAVIEARLDRVRRAAIMAVSLFLTAAVAIGIFKFGAIMGAGDARENTVVKLWSRSSPGKVRVYFGRCSFTDDGQWAACAVDRRDKHDEEN